MCMGGVPGFQEQRSALCAVAMAVLQSQCGCMWSCWNATNGGLGGGEFASSSLVVSHENDIPTGVLRRLFPENHLSVEKSDLCAQGWHLRLRWA